MAIKTYSNKVLGINKKENVIAIVGSTNFTILVSDYFYPGQRPVPVLLTMYPKNSQLVGILPIPTEFCFKIPANNFEDNEMEKAGIVSECLGNTTLIVKQIMFDTIRKSEWVKSHPGSDPKTVEDLRFPLTQIYEYYDDPVAMKDKIRGLTGKNNVFYNFKINPRFIYKDIRSKVTDAFYKYRN